MSNDGPPIRSDEVLALARLAHLELTPEETRRLTGDLGNILAHVRQLDELDVSAVPPTAHVLDAPRRGSGLPPLRADEPAPSLPRERALAEAPSVQEGGFAVPAFVDEG